VIGTKRLFVLAWLLAAMPLAAQQAIAPGTVGKAAGTGPYPAIAEVRVEAPQYTIYRPERLPAGKLPLVLWGNGGCRDNGLSASHFLREIASHGYIVVANGRARQEREARAALPPPMTAANIPPPTRTADETQVSGLLGGIDWAVAADADGASALHNHIDTAKIAVLGHSCGGLQALAAGTDPRIDTVIALASGVYVRPNSGLSGVDVKKNDLAKLHTPVAYILGGPEDIAYVNGMDDFTRIDHVPVMVANLPVGHGGTFAQYNGGDWARVAAHWLNWQLKGDVDAGRWFTGPDCRLCTSYGWSIERKNFPETP